MAEVTTGGGDKAKKGKPKKMTLRVDFTPMVDMNMLLITFFMFCTSLAKPQTMEIAMPAKDDVKQEEKSKVKDTKAITVILGGDNKIYYYLGKQPAYTDSEAFKIATYGGTDDKNSLRSLLMTRNSVAVAKVKELRNRKNRKEIKEEFYKEEVSKIKNDKNGEVVIIKPTDASTYQNLIDALDEMAISSIGIYAIDDPNEGELWLVKNHESGGELAKQSEIK
jgi:biopolymer transport protein ExbD